MADLGAQTGTLLDGDAERDSRLTLPAPVLVVDRMTLLKRFVERYAGRFRQRSAGWLAAKLNSIGGSELATVLGCNPYCKLPELVRQKAGLGPKFAGAPPVWWGTLLEPVIESVVAADLGTELCGTDINVPAPFAGHANSPDGYGVVTVVLGESAKGDLVWDVVDTSPAGRELAAAAAKAHGRAQTATVLLEFKAPYMRVPKAGQVPKHYLPQVRSGLALSPPADFGLFVDACFRRCSLEALGPSPEYDETYHRDRAAALVGLDPYAWGVVAIYAPSTIGKAPPLEDGTCPAHVAWTLRGEYFGSVHTDPINAVDFGDCSARAFDTMLEMTGKSAWRSEHSRPFFADGRARAADCDVATSLGEEFERLEGACPDGFHLLGYFPWKLLMLEYVPVERQPGFLDEIRPLVERALSLVARAREHLAGPTEATAAGRRSAAAAAERLIRTEADADAEADALRAGRKPCPKRDDTDPADALPCGLTEEDMSNFFDSISGGGAA